MQNVSANTNAPNIFNMSKLLHQCLPSSSSLSQNAERNLKIVPQHPSMSSNLTENWTREFENGITLKSSTLPDNDWVNLYILQNQSNSNQTLMSNSLIQNQQNRNELGFNKLFIFYV